MSNRFSVHNHNRKWKNGDLPMNAFVSVNLASHATAQGVGEIALTCQLANDAEVDYEIDCLIKELEAIRKAAKNEIMRHNEKVLSSLIRKTDSERGDNPLFCRPKKARYTHFIKVDAVFGCYPFQLAGVAGFDAFSPFLVLLRVVEGLFFYS